MFRASLGIEVVNLLKRRRFEELAERFGYALSFGKKKSNVISLEVMECLSLGGVNAKLSEDGESLITAKFMEPNSSGIVAVVECILPIENGAGELLVELIVTESQNKYHVTLEQISYQA